MYKIEFFDGRFRVVHLETLLPLAASQAGIDYKRNLYSANLVDFLPPGHNEYILWDPIRKDDHALQLSAYAAINVKYEGSEIFVSMGHHLSVRQAVEYSRLASTRLAITKIAALKKHLEMEKS